MKFAPIVIALSLLASGCATQSYHINGGGSVADRQEMQTFFIGGIAQEQGMNAAEICGGADKVAKVESELTFLDGLLGGLTFGIYTPRTARVYCTK